MRSGPVLGLGLCLWLQANAALALGPRESELVARADRAYAQGHTARSLLLLRRAQTRAPTDVPLTLKLVAQLLPNPRSPSRVGLPAKDAPLEALRLLDALSETDVAMDSTEQRLHAQLRAWALSLQGNFSEAVYALRERGSMGDAETAHWLQSVAALAVEHEDLVAAEEAVRAARRFLPNDPVLMSDLAALLLAQGLTESSLPLWEARFGLDPQNLEARRDLASAWLLAGRARQAHTLLEEVREACDAAPNCALESARAALEMGEPKLAIARLAADFSGDAMEALFMLGDAHTRLGAMPRARKAYEQILRQKPGNLRALENLRALSNDPPQAPSN